MTRFTPAAVAAPRVPQLSRRKKGRHAVVVGSVPATWHPVDPGDVPNQLVEIKTLATGLTLAQSIAETRCYNRDALESDTGTWAVILFRAKCGQGVQA